jgi:mitogen-activated protein kinase organizer 1
MIFDKANYAQMSWPVYQSTSLSTILTLEPINAMQISQDGQILLVSTLDSTIRLLDRSNGGLLQEMQGHVSQNYSVPVCFGYGERSVIGGSEDGRVLAWQTSTGDQVKQVACHGGKVVLGLAHHPKAAQMMTSGSDGTITMWTA